ncbi:hypothetical protein [Kaarinaea lacus]
MKSLLINSFRTDRGEDPLAAGVKRNLDPHNLVFYPIKVNDFIATPLYHCNMGIRRNCFPQTFNPVVFVDGGGWPQIGGGTQRPKFDDIYQPVMTTLPPKLDQTQLMNTRQQPFVVGEQPFN